MTVFFSKTKTLKKFLQENTDNVFTFKFDNKLNYSIHLNILNICWI